MTSEAELIQFTWNGFTTSRSDTLYNWGMNYVTGLWRWQKNTPSPIMLIFFNTCAQFRHSGPATVHAVVCRIPFIGHTHACIIAWGRQTLASLNNSVILYKPEELVLQQHRWLNYYQRSRVCVCAHVCHHLDKASRHSLSGWAWNRRHTGHMTRPENNL